MSLKNSILYFVCIVSGFALRTAFPEFCQKDAAWFSLVPLFIILRFSNPRRGFYYAFVFGLSFWWSSLAWLLALRNNGGPVILVVLGFAGLGIWCSLFTGLFGMAASFLWRGGDIYANRLNTESLDVESGCGEKVKQVSGFSSLWFETWRPAVLALLWVGSEYIRSTLFTGFAWNSLGVSQVEFLSLIQIASLGGVYAVSFVVVLLNASCANVCVRLWRNVRRNLPDGIKPVRRHLDFLVSLVLITAVHLYGVSEVKKVRYYESMGDYINIAAINPEMSSIFEQTADEVREVYARLSERTEITAAAGAELVVWPETTLFYTLPDQAVEKYWLSYVQAMNVPILAGGTEIVLSNDTPPEELVMNSSFLFGLSGSIEATYRKQHLVPFGEYIPFDKTFKFLQYLAPAGVSCTSGEGPVIMDIAEGKARVAPLICFEDTVSDLSRAAVNAGAQILINQSNDAWFYGSSEAGQHHAQAVFRAVENRVPIVRASNRGVTAAISASGMLLTEDTGGLYFSLPIPVANTVNKTIYTRFGDWVLGIPCAALFVAFLLVTMYIKKAPV